jgi:hypothetical protein
MLDAPDFIINGFESPFALDVFSEPARRSRHSGSLPYRPSRYNAWEEATRVNIVKTCSTSGRGENRRIDNWRDAQRDRHDGESDQDD